MYLKRNGSFVRIFCLSIFWPTAILEMSPASHLTSKNLIGAKIFRRFSAFSFFLPFLEKLENKTIIKQEHAGALKSGHRGNAASLKYYLPYIIAMLTTAYSLRGLALN